MTLGMTCRLVTLSDFLFFFLINKSKRGLLAPLLLCVSEFDLRSFLCTESEQLIWKSQGLPSDDLSVENALVILQVWFSFN